MKLSRIISIVLFVLYLFAVPCVTFIYPLRERRSDNLQYHFIPLETTLAQIHDPAQYNTPGFWQMFTISITGNILLFLPLGFFLRHFSNLKNRSIVFWAMAVSILIELLQLYSHTGVCDIDDVILNSTGALAGIYLYTALNKIPGFRLK